MKPDLGRRCGWVNAIGLRYAAGLGADREERAMSNNKAPRGVREQLYAGSSSSRRALARRALKSLWPGLFFIISLATVVALALQRP